MKNYSLEIEVSFCFLLLALRFGFQRPAAIYLPNGSGTGSAIKQQETQTTPGSFSAVSAGAVRQRPCGVTDRQRKAPASVLCRAVTNEASMSLVESYQC